MPIARLTLELEIPHAQSIKDRRQVVRSLKDRLRRHYNCSVAELDDANLWNRATLGIASISGSGSYLQAQIVAIDRACHRLSTGLGAIVLDSWADILPD